MTLKEEFRKTLPKEFIISLNWNDEDVNSVLHDLGLDWLETDQDLVNDIAEAVSDKLYEVNFYCELTKDFKVIVKRTSVKME